MRIRNVQQEYEVQLRPSPGGAFPSARGKGEWKVYADGTRQCKLSVSGLDALNGAFIELSVEQRRITHLTVEHGSARYRRETERGEGVPAVALGERLKVIYLGQVVLEGQFYEE